MDDIEILPTDVITDSLPLLPDIPDIPDLPDITDILDIPDIPDIPEDVIVVPATPLSYPLPHSTTTVSSAHTQLTYVTQGNVSYRLQTDTAMSSNATTTTINVPTATEAPFKPPTLMVARRPRQAESGPSPQKKQKTGETVFLTPLPVTSHARQLTRITKNVQKPKPSSDSDQNQIIKALLAQKSTPYLTCVSGPRHKNFIIRASTQTSSGKTKILNLPVSASMPVSLANLPSGTPVRPLLAQNAMLLKHRPTLRSAFVKTTTTADFIPQSSTVDTVISTHVTTTTTITTPMTTAPQLTYAMSPIRVATSASTPLTTSVRSSPSPTRVFISSPSPKPLAGAMPSKTFVPAYKPDAVTTVKTHDLVSNNVLLACSGTTVTTPASITMLGPHGFTNTTAGVTTLVQRPSANTRAKTHNYTYLEPGEITQIRKVPPRTFPGPRSTFVAQRQASAAAAIQQQATIISKMKAAKHAQHHAESQAMSGLELGSTREVQHAASLAALQEASHAKLVAASQEARLKAQEALFQAKIRASVEAQKAAATSPVATQAQALPAPLQLPVTTQLQIASLGPTQTVSLAQPHGHLNVQLLTPAQAKLFANAKAHLQTTSQGQILGIPQSNRVTYSQAQAQALTASRLQDESLATSQLRGQPLASPHVLGPLATSQQQGQSLSSSEPQAQVPAYMLATSKTQGNHISTSQPPTYILATSQSQGPILITSQRQAQRQDKSQSQAPIFIAPQRQALIATTPSQGQLLATSQAQSLASLQTQTNVTLPVQIKSPQSNANLIAQLNAPSQMIVSKGQKNTPRMQLRATPAQLKNITQAQLNAITQAQLKTSQWRQKTESPTQMVSPTQQSAMHSQPSPRPRHRLIIKTANPAPPIDNTPVTQNSMETVTVSTSLNEHLPSTSSVSQQIEEVPSSSIHTTSTLTLSTGTTLIMPHYKTTVFKNLSSIGRAEPTRLPAPKTSPGERVVIRRPATFFPARRTFPTTTQSSMATPTSTVTTTTTSNTTPVIRRHIIRTIPRHMLDSLKTGNARIKSDGTNSSEIPTYIITQNKPKSEGK